MAASTYPTELPARTQAAGSWKSRNCPNMRSCWSFSLSSYSLQTSDKGILARRICMLTVLGVRTFMSVWAIIKHAFGGRLLSLIVGSVLAVIGFVFIAWCLATIGEAKGYRKVLGVMVGRWHFDIFLLAMAVIHIGLLISSFFGFDDAGLPASWLVLWLVIFGVAWVATWEPEGSGSAA